MTWGLTLLTALLTGALGLLCGGFLMNLCVGWYRVSSFEGKAGFAVVGVALLGGIAGFVVGLVAARMVAAGAAPTFLKGLGAGVGAVLAIAAVATLLCRLAADLAPTIDGCDLEIAVEIRCPEGFPDPGTFESRALYTAVQLPGGGRQPSGTLHAGRAREDGGRWIVEGTVPLDTSASTKYLRAFFDTSHDALFSLPLRSHPSRSDLEWSDWVLSGWDVGKPEPPAEQRYRMRFRVQKVAPPDAPAPEPDRTEEEELAAIAHDAPLEEWLAHLGDGTSEARVQAVRSIVEERPADLARLIDSTESSHRELALAAVAHLIGVAPEIADAVQAEGREVAAGLRRFNAMAESDPEFLPVQVELRSRFGSWKRAWWRVFHQLGLDGRPPVQEILDLARVRARTTSMSEIVLGARAILDALPAAEK